MSDDIVQKKRSGCASDACAVARVGLGAKSSNIVARRFRSGELNSTYDADAERTSRP